MHLRAILLFLVFFTASSYTDPELVKTKVADGITVSLPTNFFPMSPDDIGQRYPSIRKPIAAYTNDQRLVDFSINLSATQWRPGDIELAKSFIKASVLEMFDEVKIIQEDIREINGHSYIVFELETKIDGDSKSFSNTQAIRKYSYLQYLLINGKMIVFSFHAPIKYKEMWQPIAPEIMSSVKVSKNI